MSNYWWTEIPGAIRWWAVQLYAEMACLNPYGRWDVTILKRNGWKIIGAKLLEGFFCHYFSIFYPILVMFDASFTILFQIMLISSKYAGLGFRWIGKLIQLSTKMDSMTFQTSTQAYANRSGRSLHGSRWSLIINPHKLIYYHLTSNRSSQWNLRNLPLTSHLPGICNHDAVARYALGATKIHSFRSFNFRYPWWQINFPVVFTLEMAGGDHDQWQVYFVFFAFTPNLGW